MSYDVINDVIMSDADCTPGREPRSVAASFNTIRCTVGTAVRKLTQEEQHFYRHGLLMDTDKMQGLIPWLISGKTSCHMKNLPPFTPHEQWSNLQNGHKVVCMFVFV